MDGDGCKLSFCETDYMQSVATEEVVASIEKAFVKNEFASWNKMFPIDHITNQFEFLKYLCSKRERSLARRAHSESEILATRRTGICRPSLKTVGRTVFCKNGRKN